jgi:hypothetical protein
MDSGTDESRRRRWAPAFAFAAAGVLNLYPLVGVLGAARLQSLYGVPVPSGDLELLMRHRAVLLGLVGATLLCAALRPVLRPFAALLGLVSMLSFVALGAAAAAPGAAIMRVLWADVIGSLVLLAAAASALRRGPA